MPAPAAPSANTVVLQTGNGQNFITWPIISGATSYKVQRSTDGVTFSALGTASVAGYLDTTCLIGIAYFYQVAASNGSGDSAYTASYPASITPCLPGQINLGYLRYFAQLESDQLNSQFITTDEWNFYLNQSAFRLYDRLVAKYGENYFLAPPLYISLIGANSYALPDGTNYPINWNFTISSGNATINAVYSSTNAQTFTVLSSITSGTTLYTTGTGSPPASGTLTLVSGVGDATITFSAVTTVNAAAYLKDSGIDVNISGGGQGPNAGWVPIARSNWSDRDRYTTWPAQAGALNNIYQMSFRVMGNQLYLFPQNMNQLIRFWYVPIRRQMLQDTDMLPFSMTGWSEYVILDTAIKGARKEESFELVEELKSERATVLASIEIAAANRSVDQPNSTSNVRQSMGDPGFSSWGNGFGGGGFGSGGWGG